MVTKPKPKIEIFKPNNRPVFKMDAQIAENWGAEAVALIKYESADDKRIVAATRNGTDADLMNAFEKAYPDEARSRAGFEFHYGPDHLIDCGLKRLTPRQKILDRMQVESSVIPGLLR